MAGASGSAGVGGGKGGKPGGASGGKPGGGGKAGAGGAAGADPMAAQLVASHARTIGMMPGDLQLQMLSQIDATNPMLGMQIRDQMSAAGGGGKGGKKTSTSSGTPKPGQMDMRPQPKQKPPRRRTASV